MIEQSEKEKLTQEIEDLKSKIKNTEYDLANMFKGNSFIEQKLVISKETLEKKEKLLEQLNSSS
jgi:predicted  nucleic acid-binding Zn-ribbon protein